MKVEVGKTYQTRAGFSVRVICTDRKGNSPYPVIGLCIEGCGERVVWFTPEGKASLTTETPWDLVPAKKKFRIEQWVNVYRNKKTGLLYPTPPWPDEAIAKSQTWRYGEYLGTFPAHIEGEVEE